MKTRIISFIACAMLVSPLHSVDDSPSSLPTYIFGTATTVSLVALAVYGYSKYRALQQKNEELSARLGGLESSFRDTPFESFRAVADQKVTEVIKVARAELDGALRGISDATDGHMRRITTDIKKLESKRRRFETEIQESRRTIVDAENFLRDVKDERGTEFVGALVKMKRHVENRLQQLNYERDHIDTDLRSLRVTLSSHSAIVSEQKETMRHLRRRLEELNSFVQTQKHVEQDIARIREVRTELMRQVEEISGKVNQLRRRLEQVLPHGDSIIERVIQNVLNMNDREMNELMHQLHPAQDQDPS